MHLALTLNQDEISWPNHATAKLCSKAVLLFWFSIIVIVRQLSVCLRLLVYFVRDSLMVIYWEIAVLLYFPVWCFTLCRLYCIIFPFGVAVCSWSLPFVCVFMKVFFFCLLHMMSSFKWPFSNAIPVEYVSPSLISLVAFDDMRSLFSSKRRRFATAVLFPFFLFSRCLFIFDDLAAVYFPGDIWSFLLT